MLLLETSAELTNPRYSRVPMDARSVAKAAGIKLNTLNAWISRGLITWVTVGTSGKRRDFDFDTAVRIAVFAELIRHLAPPEYAALAAKGLSDTRMHRGWLYVVPALVADRWTIAHFSGDAPGERASDLIRQWEDSPDPQASPTFFAGINVGKLVQKVRQVEQEWQQSREAKT